MYRMRFRLLTLHLLLLVSAIAIAAILNTRHYYREWKTLNALQNEVDSALKSASDTAKTQPHSAIQDVVLLRKTVSLSPLLDLHERNGLLQQIDEQLVRLRHYQSEYERKWAAIDTSCGVPWLE